MNYFSGGWVRWPLIIRVGSSISGSSCLQCLGFEQDTELGVWSDNDNILTYCHNDVIPLHTATTSVAETEIATGSTVEELVPSQTIILSNSNLWSLFTHINNPEWRAASVIWILISKHSGQSYKELRDNLSWVFTEHLMAHSYIYVDM